MIYVRSLERIRGESASVASGMCVWAFGVML